MTKFVWSGEKKELLRFWGDDFRELHSIIQSIDGPIVNESWLDKELYAIGKCGIAQKFIDMYKSGKKYSNPSQSSVAFFLGVTDEAPSDYPKDMVYHVVRTSPPDVDIDNDDRDWMINYAKEKYGENRVAQIATFARIKPKSGIRDAAKILGHDYATGDRLAKMVPDAVLGVEKTMEEALLTPDLAREYRENDESRRILDVAKGLEGTQRSDGLHAAGVIIAQSDITDYIPVKVTGGKNPVLATQIDMDWCERLGMLKADFLGLRNLFVIADTIERVKERLGIEIVRDEIPLDDHKTYEMLQRGHAIGVFQVESEGMRGIMVDLGVDSIYDIMALIALYRPGPLGSGMHQMYIDRKRGRQKVEYPHPSLEDKLDKSLGIMLYQEDVLNVITTLAGWSMGEADDLRRVIGRKKMDEIANYRPKFVDGCVSHSGITETQANKIFDEIEYFAGYGFNLAHCLPGDAPLVTPFGSTITINEILEKDAAVELLAYNTSTGETFTDWCINVIDEGEQDVYEVTLSDGETIRCTMGHKFLCTDGEYHTLCSVVDMGLEMVSANGGKDPIVPVEVKCVGRERVYNLSMASPEHNYVMPNGLVNKNSASYAMVSYATAYLKANYPYDYMASLLSSVVDHPDKMATYLDECNRMGIEVLPPSLSKSEAAFSVEEDGVIRFGFTGIRGIGDGFISALPDDRAEGYGTLQELLRNIGTEVLDTGTFMHLAKSGALDEIALGKGTPLPIARKSELLTMEKDAIGVYLTDHPLRDIAHLLDEREHISISQLSDLPERARASLAGIVTSVQKRTVKRSGASMYIVRLEDLTGSIEMLVFPKVFPEYEGKINVGDIVHVEGSHGKDVSYGDDGEVLSVRSKLFMSSLGHIRVDDLEESPINISFDNAPDDDTIKLIDEIVKSHPGNSSVFIRFPDKDTDFVFLMKKKFNAEKKEKLSSFGELT